MQLLVHFKNLISNDLLHKLSVYLDENEVLVRKTIEVCVGTVLLGIHLQKKPEALSFFTKEITLDFERELDGFCAKEVVFPEGMYCIEHLFSVKKDRIPEMISNELCVKSTTARAILHLVALVIVSHIKTEQPKTLQNMLEEQYAILARVLPRGVRLVMGITAVEVAAPVLETIAEERGGFSFFRFKKKSKK